MDKIHGGVVSATDIRKHWKSIVNQVVTEKTPAYVLSYNAPMVVILDYKEYELMQKKMSEYQKKETKFYVHDYDFKQKD